MTDHKYSAEIQRLSITFRTIESVDGIPSRGMYMGLSIADKNPLLRRRPGSFTPVQVNGAHTFVVRNLEIAYLEVKAHDTVANRRIGVSSVVSLAQIKVASDGLTLIRVPILTREGKEACVATFALSVTMTVDPQCTAAGEAKKPSASCVPPWSVPVTRPSERRRRKRKAVFRAMGKVMDVLALICMIAF
ncbi:hypothetical protein AMAG_15062 [Allomyces macrogynus ATCC 38327]|uniref:Uncharacterized protein n=1 Tax=Allomyces macrogynus (strain ATCC 38327) TaxID=578462 RepID=A0A0L0T5X2_ALLM3|nr:hypothetical protein AMAG_15062 [Allomyces macrogynus ATCC 38327]|eukprot:KNE70081.1 hypothetical protein AMAG_15062 [Allomyces macrogynus ATCC 38327]